MQLVRPETINALQGLTSSSVPMTEALWSGASTYALNAIVYKVVGGVPMRFQSLQNSNTNHDPETDNGTWWVGLGPTNRYGMFDGKVQTQTTAADSIVVVVQAAGRVDTIALLNIAGRSVRIEVTDPFDGLVVDETFSLTSASGILDMEGYFLEPIVRKADLVVSLKTKRAAASVKITLSGSGETVAIGALLVGFARSLGGTKWGGSVGYDDYSVKGKDAFGNAVVIERPYSKHGDFQVEVEKGFLDEMQRLLAQYRATPILYIADDRWACMALYGFNKGIETVVNYETSILGALPIESLT